MSSYPTLQNPAYKARLSFTREFTRGNLKGLQHEDSIPFVKAGDAIEWVNAINRKNAEGRVDYKVIAFNVEVK